MRLLSSPRTSITVDADATLPIERRSTSPDSQSMPVSKLVNQSLRREFSVNKNLAREEIGGGIVV